MEDHTVVAGMAGHASSSRPLPAAPQNKAAVACVLAGAAAVIMSLIAPSAYAANIGDGQIDNVDAGETSSSDQIFFGGLQNVNSGGTALSTVISNGGTQNIFSGGIATSAFVSIGGVQNISGGYAENTAVAGTQNIFDGGRAVGALVAGQQIVSSGGLSLNTTVGISALQQLNVGAIASNTTLIVGDQIINSGAKAIQTTVSSGGRQNINSGGEAFQTTVKTAGLQFISSGGRAIGNDFTGNSAEQFVNSAGTAFDNVFSAGTQIVSAGAVVSGTTLYGGFVFQQINSGASVVATTLVSGGSQNVPDGATAIQTLINPGTMQAIASGGLAIAATISSAGTQTVAAGANANDTTLYGGGIQLINSGGTVTDTHVVSGGIQNVTAGATAIHSDVGEGSIQNVSAGGVATNTEIDLGGLQVILAAALVSGTLINVGGSAAARQTGVSLSNLIFNGGTLWLNDPDAGAVKPASFNQVTVNGLSGSGTVAFATEFTAQDGDKLNLQNGQGLVGVTVRDYSTTDADPTQRLLLITTDPATTTQATLNGRYVDVGAFQYGLVKDGNQYFLAAKTEEPATPGSGGGTNIGGGSGGTPGGDGGGGGGGGDSADDGIGGTNGLVPTDTTQTVVAAAKAAGAIWYDQLQQVQKRFGDLRSSTGNDGAWARGYGDERHLFDPGVKIDEGGMQAGIDHRIRTDNGDWIVGFTAGAGYASLDMGASGTGNATQWNIGVYGLWLNDAGWYASTTAKYNALDQHVSSVTGEGIPVSAAYNLSGYTVSFEGGRRFTFNQGWFVEPQAEWTLTHGGAASYTTNTGLPVNVEAATAQLGRVGVSFGKRIALSDEDFVEPYMRLSAVRQFSGDNAVVVAGSPFDVTTRTTYGVASIGATARYRKQLQFYGEVGYARGSNYAMPWSINAGLRYTW